MNQLCENCNYEYNPEESIYKKEFKIKIGKQNWCDKCIVDSDIEDELLKENNNDT